MYMKIASKTGSYIIGAKYAIGTDGYYKKPSVEGSLCKNNFE